MKFNASDDHFTNFDNLPIATTADNAVREGSEMSIWRMSVVKAETGHRSHASIYSAIHAGLSTKPVPIEQPSVGWPSEEVKAINAARIAGKTEAELRELIQRLHVKRTELAAI